MRPGFRRIRAYAWRRSQLSGDVHTFVATFPLTYAATLSPASVRPACVGEESVATKVAGAFTALLNLKVSFRTFPGANTCFLLPQGIPKG